MDSIKNHKIIIAGGRDFFKYEIVEEYCDVVVKNISNPFIISGGQRGADQLGERYARERNIPLKIIPANWNKYGKSAGPIRNREMSKEADRLIAFWDGKSKGTKDMIDVAKSKGIPIHICKIETV